MMQPVNGVAQPQASMSIDQQQQQYYQQYQQPAHPQHWMMQQQQQQQPIQTQWAQQQPYQAAVPQPLAQQPQYVAAPTAGSDEIRSLWIGDLQSWMTEDHIKNWFSHTGELVSVKLIRNKHSGEPEGYGFIEFSSHAAAERILQSYNGAPIPTGGQNYRLNWAALAAGERRADDSSDFTIFVGDLAHDVSDYLLQETFKHGYPSVKGAKVVTDRTTGRSKGYGFVRFGDESEQLHAMSEMNGMLCSSRPMRIGPAATKKPQGVMQEHQKVSYQNSQGSQGESDPNNTTIFVGGLDPNVSDDDLRQVFGQFGELVHVKIPVGKRCGFVQFVNRGCAEQALSLLNGTQLGGTNVRLSWGRNPSNKQALQQQQDQSHWNGAAQPYYGYAQQGYEAYGYAAQPAQDPSMYYGAAYAGYGNFQQPQQ